MYERMLNKQAQPSCEEFTEYCGERKALFEKADDFLTNQLLAEKEMRFPYGKHYGWGMKYFIKSKHICDIFAEKGAFTVMLRLADSQFNKIYDESLPETKELIDNKYPCGSGGWIHYRVLTQRQLEDVFKMLRLKAGRE